MAPALEAGRWPGRQAVRRWPWPAAASLLAHLLAAVLLWHRVLPARSGPHGDAPAMVEVTFADSAVAGPPAPPWVAPVVAPAPPAVLPMLAYAPSIPPPVPSVAAPSDLPAPVLPPPPVLASLPPPASANLLPPVPAVPLPAPTGPAPVPTTPASAPAGPPAAATPVPASARTPPAAAAPAPASRATEERPRRPPSRPGSGVPSSPAVAAAPGVATGAAIPASPVTAAAEGPPLIAAPRFRRTPLPPDYPPRAVELDLTGTVVIRALLDAAGDPREVRVQRSSGHPLLDGAAIAAVRRWAFEPAARDGRRIEAWVEVPVHFRLN